jgi:hypothetical protein
MLHPAYALRKSGISTEYNKELEVQAVRSFLDNMEGDGYGLFLKKQREMYLSLYDEYLQRSGKRIFVDKTPRYYNIYDELTSIFPHARYIILKRHPLAVLQSVLSTWVSGSWHHLANFKCDLVDSIALINRIPESNGSLHLSYESLVDAPEEEVKRVCGFLNIDYDSRLIKELSTGEKWELGDQASIYTEPGVAATKRDKWKKKQMDMQTWRIFHDYLVMIGEDTFHASGYDYEASEKNIKSLMPAESVDHVLEHTLPLELLLDDVKNYLVQNASLKNRVDVLSRQVQDFQKLKRNYQELSRHLGRIEGGGMFSNPVKKLSAFRNLMHSYRNQNVKPN